MATNGLENRKYVAQFEYDFNRDGGAVGDITLRGASLPDGALIDIGKVFVNAQVTSGGLATLALKLVSSDDVLAASPVAGFTANAIMDTVPNGTAANAVRVTTNGTKLILTVGTAALTAGKFTACLEYYIVD